ncbi:MAG: hypothetical protein DWQ06_06765 [Calditrichaeota bacterium]|nr:MAG: hypothetical protein DWQ06_06765 [Calditrichota bacterium]
MQVRNSKLKFLDYFFVLRPSILVPVWAFFFAGVFKASQVKDLSLNHFSPSPKILIYFLAFTLVMGAVYILNQIFDRETDKQNDKLYFLSEGIISVKNASIEIFILLGISFFLSSFMNLNGIILLILLTILGIFYSVPPIKLKARPIFDLLANALAYGTISFLAGWNSVTEFALEDLIFSVPSFFCAGAVFLNTTFLDYEGDKKTNQITSAVFFGQTKVLLFALFLLILGIVSAIYLQEFVSLGMGLISFFFFYKAFSTKTQEWTLKSVLFGTESYTVISALIFPYFLFFLLVIFLLTKFYYKSRFGLNYPKLTK